MGAGAWRRGVSTEGTVFPRTSATIMVTAGLLTGCGSPLTMPISLPLDVASTAAEDRKLGEVKDDVSIKVAILSKFTKEAKGLLVDASADVYMGEVMLTGSVRQAEARTKAVELAGQVEGVRRIFNDIQLLRPDEPTTPAKDLTIELKMKANLLAARGVSSINYRWRAVNGVVYLIGQAQSQEELDKVLAVIRKMGSVRDVVTHIRIKPISGF